MEIIFIISYIIGIIICILFTIIAWKTKDKEMWNTLPYGWLAMVLCGWVLGISVLLLMIYIVFIKPRFK
jgi:NADH:ubiquinone oxidoreductase subunit 6 (subunit J)